MKIRPFATIKMNYTAIFNYTSLALLNGLILANSLLEHKMTYKVGLIIGYACCIIFLFPLVQGFFMLGMDYYYRLGKQLVSIIKSKCQHSNTLKKDIPPLPQ